MGIRGPAASLPFEPLMAFLARNEGRPLHPAGENRCRYCRTRYDDESGDHCVNIRYFADRIGELARTVARWREKGGLPKKRADEVAVKLGAHPSEIWIDWFDDLGGHGVQDEAAVG